MSVGEIIKELECLGRKKNVDGMQRHGVASKAKLGKIELWKAKFKSNKNVIKSAKEVQKINLKNSKWIAKDAIKELTGEKFKKGWKEECCE